MAPTPRPPQDDPREAQAALARTLTPGQRVERLADLCRQLEEVRRAGASAR